MITRTDIVTEALDWLGTPFADCQATKHIGVDCVGLILGVGRALGIAMPAIPQYSPQWHLHHKVEKLVLTMEELGLQCKALSQRAPGDILVFRLKPDIPCSHLGIQVDSDKMVHAATSKELTTGRVLMAKLRGKWLGQLHYVFHFPGVES